MRPQILWWCVSQSILAYIKEAMGVTRPRRLSTDVFAASESTSLPRDRDRRTRKPSMPQTRHDRPKQLSGRPRSAKSPRAHLSESGPRSTVRTLSSSSLDPKEPEQERLGRPRRRRTQGSTQEMVSLGRIKSLCVLNRCSIHAVLCRGCDCDKFAALRSNDCNT